MNTARCLTSSPPSTEKFNLTFLLIWSTRFLQKLRDILKRTRKSRADNRSDHFHHRKRKFENLFSILPLKPSSRSLGADTVAGETLTSNEFLRNLELASRKDQRTKKSRNQNLEFRIRQRRAAWPPEHCPYTFKDCIRKTLSLG
jgi:hypothetical protein